MDELALLKELAGVNEITKRDLEKDWAEKNTISTELPKSEQIEQPTVNFVQQPNPYEDLANRLNSKICPSLDLGVKIERL